MGAFCKHRIQAFSNVSDMLANFDDFCMKLIDVVTKANDSHMDFTFRENAKDPVINSDFIFHDHELIAIAKSASNDLKLNTCTGCYCWTLGPSYETPAEIQDMARLGGGAVGMSTVPVIKTSAQLGIKTLTIS